MERTWRWFGKKDKITLAQLRQIGVEGIVTALHDVPLGEVWTREKIRDLREYIESYGMRWSVVESLPVVETIKYGGPDRDHQIEVYKESLRNLAAEGIHCICYNFMPVLDWARTDLFHDNPNGATNLYFNYAEFAYFDIYILKRPGAREEWEKFQFPEGWGQGRSVIAECDELAKTMTPEKDHKLVENIVIKTQGFVSGNFSENDEAPVRTCVFTPTIPLSRFLACPASYVPRRISSGSWMLFPTSITDSPSVLVRSLQALITMWLSWLRSLPLAHTSFTCVRATSSPMATLLRPLTWAVVPI